MDWLISVLFLTWYKTIIVMVLLCKEGEFQAISSNVMELFTSENIYVLVVLNFLFSFLLIYFIQDFCFFFKKKFLVVECL